MIKDYISYLKTGYPDQVPDYLRDRIHFDHSIGRLMIHGKPWMLVGVSDTSVGKHAHIMPLRDNSAILPAMVSLERFMSFGSMAGSTVDCAQTPKLTLNPPGGKLILPTFVN